MSIGSVSTKCLASFVLACALTHAAAFGADGPATAEDAGMRAQVLLKRAVAHYQDNKEPALADFTSKSQFVDRELYVYVVSTTGVLLASGGPSSSVIGRNVANQQDALGKYFFRELLAKARSNVSGTVEYQWLNPVNNKVERKVAQFQKIGNRIIVVGHYVAHATPEQAQALLARAVDALRADPRKAVEAFNSIFRSPYAEDDLYVFVIGLSDKRVHANGADPRLIGTDPLSLRVPEGKLVLEKIAAAGERDQTEMDYKWPNPVTGRVENKHIFLRRVGDMVVGVGYYVR